MALSATNRKRLEIPGFTGLDDDLLREVEPWLRFALVSATHFCIPSLTYRTLIGGREAKA